MRSTGNKGEHSTCLTKTPERRQLNRNPHRELTPRLEGHKPNWTQRQRLPDLDAHVRDQGNTNKREVAGNQRPRSRSPAQRTCLGKKKEGAATGRHHCLLCFCLVSTGEPDLPKVAARVSPDPKLFLEIWHLPIQRQFDPLFP